MKRIFLTSIVFLFSTLIWAVSEPVVQFNVLTDPLQLEPGQIKSVRMTIEMPKGFHAYSDQFKVMALNPEFSVGQLMLSPEIEFYDKYTKKTKKGLFEQGEIQIQIEAPEKLSTMPQKISFDLRYQICSDQVCYLPQKKNISLNVNSTSLNPATNNADNFSFFSTGTIENQLSKSFLLTYFLVFLAGVLTSFTPCIFPMIPITLSILGHDAETKNRTQNVLRSIFYVLGIALTYATLGSIAALTGALFGKALANKYVISSLVVLFVLMAISMWGFFEIQVPAFIRNKFGTGKSHGYFGALIMGLVAGIVASPCVGPVLVSILSFVSSTQSVWLGFTLLFTFAIGLGLIFIVLGFSSHLIKKLPRSGPWMDLVKFLLGLLMIGAAFYYLQFVLDFKYWVIVLGLSLMAISFWKGAFNYKKRHPLKQGLALACFIFSTTLALLAVFKIDYVKPLFNESISTEKQNNVIQWIPYSEKILQQAVSQSKPVLIDFFAEWCAACHELEEKTYTEPEFIELSKQFVLVKVDATEDTDEVQKILTQYNIKGLPTVVFVNRKGAILNDLTFTQFLDWKELKPKVLEALK